MVSRGGPALEADVLVVGGGPAGLATALAARRHGLSVVVAERGEPPLDKACGEGLMPDGVAALRSLGVVPGLQEGFPFHGIRFIESGRVAEARFPQGHGLGLRRTRLHRLLADRAQEVGVVLRWRAPVDVRDPERPRVGDRILRCRWIVGADGAQSRVRRSAGLTASWTGPRRIGVRQHFRLRPWSDAVEVHWRNGGQAYVTPTGPEEVCVAILADAPVRPHDVPAMFPELGRRLGGAEQLGVLRGALSLSLKLGRVTRGRIALVGDASGAVDAITGEGIALALRQAAALGDALAVGDLARYEKMHRRMSRVPLRMTRLLLLLGTHDGLRRRALHALAEEQGAFAHLLAVHVAARHPLARPAALCRFGLRFIGPETFRADMPWSLPRARLTSDEAGVEAVDRRIGLSE
jgi:flavin-dependent dehydrogenase